MCTGPELAAVAALAAGTQYTMEKRANNALNDKTMRIISDTNSKNAALQQVREQQQKEQDALQQQQNAATAQTTQNFSPEQQKRQLEEQQAAATQQLQLDPSFSNAAAPQAVYSGAPTVVQDAINKRLQESSDKAQQYAVNLGGLEGYAGSNFLNNMGVTNLGQQLATAGKISQSKQAVANEADTVHGINNNVGQNMINIWTQQNANGGMRQAAAAASAVKNAAMFAALTGGIGAAGNTGAIGTESTAAPGTFGSYGPQPANARFIGGSNPSFGAFF